MSRATEGERREPGRRSRRARRRPRPGAARYYIIEVDGTGTPERHGPFAAGDYGAAARRIHGEVDDDSVLLLARVTNSGFTVEAMRRSFLEGDAEDEDEEAEE